MLHQSLTTIVLTGGPCAGKSSSLSYVASHLTQKGYHVVVIDELATELQRNGFIPGKTISPLLFQEMVLREALSREHFYKESSKKSLHQKSIILCDRGIADSKAYVSQKEWGDLLATFTLNDEDVLGRYDMVLHLRSVAVDKPHLYTQENNLSRRESREEAVLVDSAVACAWEKHPTLRIINNEGEFEHKKARIVSEILHFLEHN